MARDRETKVRILGEDKSGPAFSSHGRHLKGVEAATKKTSERMSKAWSSYVTGLKRTMQVGATAFVGYMVYATRAASKQEEVERLLADAMRTRKIYTDELAQSLKDYAAELQDVTKYGDEEIIAVETLLIRYGVAADKIKELTELTLNVARAKQQDTRATAEFIAKAAVGYTSMLTRWGIFIDQNLSQTEKINDAMRQLAEMAGKAAYELTFWDRIVQLKNSFGDLAEAIGEVITKAEGQEEIFEVIKSKLEEWTKWARANHEAIRDQAKEIYEKLKPALDKILGPLGKIGTFAIEHPDVLGTIFVATTIALATTRLIAMTVAVEGLAAAMGLAGVARVLSVLGVMAGPIGIGAGLAAGGAYFGARKLSKQADSYEATFQRNLGQSFRARLGGGFGVSSPGRPPIVSGARSVLSDEYLASLWPEPAPSPYLGMFDRTGKATIFGGGKAAGYQRFALEMGDRYRARGYTPPPSRKKDFKEPAKEVDTFAEKIKGAFVDISDAGQIWASTIRSTWDSVTGAIVENLMDTRVDVEMIMRDIRRMMLRSAINMVGGAIFSSLPGFASGGSFVTRGPMPILVGESGPEHVQVTPVNKAAPAGVSLTFNIQAMDSENVVRFFEKPGNQRAFYQSFVRDFALGRAVM